MFQNRPWIFQLNSAPAHKVKTRQWLENHVPEFIGNDHWPSASSGLNPLSYKLWSILEGKIFTTCYYNPESLKQALVEVVDNFLMDVVCTAIVAWSNRLQHCIKANGDHFEYFFCNSLYQ